MSVHLNPRISKTNFYYEERTNPEQNLHAPLTNSFAEPHRFLNQSNISPITQIPDISTLIYTHEHLTGGGGGVYILRDEFGKRYVLKAPQSIHAFKEELLNDAIYRALGINVPLFEIYE